MAEEGGREAGRARGGDERGGRERERGRERGKEGGREEGGGEGLGGWVGDPNHLRGDHHVVRQAAAGAAETCTHRGCRGEGVAGTACPLVEWDESLRQCVLLVRVSVRAFMYTEPYVQTCVLCQCVCEGGSDALHAGWPAYTSRAS